MHMTNWHEEQYPVLPVHKFRTHVKEIYSTAGDQVFDDIFDTATEYLHQMGEVSVDFIIIKL